MVGYILSSVHMQFLLGFIYMCLFKRKNDTVILSWRSSILIIPIIIFYSYIITPFTRCYKFLVYVYSERLHGDLEWGLLQLTVRLRSKQINIHVIRSLTGIWLHRTQLCSNVRKERKVRTFMDIIEYIYHLTCLT